MSQHFPSSVVVGWPVVVVSVGGLEAVVVVVPGDLVVVFVVVCVGLGVVGPSVGPGVGPGELPSQPTQMAKIPSGLLMLMVAEPSWPTETLDPSMMLVYSPPGS